MSLPTEWVAVVETIELQNVVGSANLGMEFDLAQVAFLDGAEYDPERFPGLLYTSADAKATVMVYGSGKVTVTGALSVPGMRESFSECLVSLRELGIPVGDTPEIRVQNMVATADFGEALNLTGVAVGVGLDRIEYEPEQFPGLVYRPEGLSVVVLVFGTGKIVVTGATERGGIETAVETVASRLADLGLLSQ